MSPKNPSTKPSTFSATEIVKDVKLHLKTASDLYDRYIEAQATSTLDPVMNGDLLREGWSDNVIYHDTVVKQVKNTFSFFLSLKDAKQIIITVALDGEDLYLHPVTLTFFAEKKEIGSVTLQYTHFAKYTISIPKQFQSERHITGVVSKANVSSQVYIRSITAVASEILANSSEESLFELEKLKRDSTQLIQFLELHKNPELLMPADTRKKSWKKIVKKYAFPLFKRFSNSILLKRIVLKMIRPFTTPQVIFNQYLLEIIQLQTKRNDKLEEMLLSAVKEMKKIKHTK